jgi:small subunit ribosomal protein S8
MMMATAVAKSNTKNVRKRPAPAIVTDPIADMLTRIRNANAARHSEVKVPASRLKLEIARVLKDEGYIAGYDVEADGTAQTMRIIFKTRPDRTRVISGVKRISRPGLRVYARKTEIPRVLGGLGIAILSTSEGVMSGRQATRQQLGGEVLAYVW